MGKDKPPIKQPVKEEPRTRRSPPTPEEMYRQLGRHLIEASKKRR